MLDEERPEPNWKLRMRLAVVGELLIAGIWMGMLLVLDAGLDVPKRTMDSGMTVAEFVPVSETVIFLSLFAVPGLAWIGVQAAMHSDDVTLDRDAAEQLHEDIDQV